MNSKEGEQNSAAYVEKIRSTYRKEEVRLEFSYKCKYMLLFTILNAPSNQTYLVCSISSSYNIINT